MPQPPTRHAILHIGTEKTGTTTIQAMLAARRDALAALGVAYPGGPHETTHVGLPSYAAPENMPGLLPPGFTPEAYSSGLIAELEALPADIHTVIFSSEFCHSRMITEGQVRRLHDLLAPHFGRFTVLVYLRRQDDMAVSALSSAIMAGHSMMDLAALVPRADAPAEDFLQEILLWYLDYEALLARWATVFGATAMQPRLHAPDTLPGGDVAADFLRACGLPTDLAPARGEGRLNSTLAGPVQAFLARLNAHMAAADLPPAEAAWLRARCAELAAPRWSGAPQRPPRAAAQDFYARFRAGNERVRACWFPDRATLFAEDFHAYPEAPDDDGVAALRQSLDVALGLITTLAARPSA